MAGPAPGRRPPLVPGPDGPRWPCWSWVRVGLAAVLVGALQVAHMFWETPADQYGTWAHGVSRLPAAPGRPNLLGIVSPALGVVSVAAAVVLSVAVPGVLVPLARTIVWQDSDVSDYRRFPARAVPTRPPVFRFRRAPGADRVPTVTVPVRHGGRVVERDLEGFLRSTGTTAFLAIKGDTLVSEAYFGGYGHDSTVSSFSVAKPVVSAQVGIAIAQDHLLTMSSGLADLDPYYDLDLRAVALRDTRIAGPAGRRFHDNNLNPISTSPSSAPCTSTGAPGGDGSSCRGVGWPSRPGSTAAPTPPPPSGTTGGPDPAPALPTTTGAKATTASSSTCPPTTTWSWSASAPTTTTTTGPTYWPRWPAAYGPEEAAVPYEPVTRGYVVGPGEGVPDQGPEVKASGRSTGGSLTLIEVAIDGGPPRHTHSREDESFYVLTGTLEVGCGDDRFRAGPGSLVFLPRHLPHGFRSVGGPATALLIVTPGGLEAYFAELSAALAANADPVQVRAIQRAYGIAREPAAPRGQL